MLMPIIEYTKTLCVKRRLDLSTLHVCNSIAVAFAFLSTSQRTSSHTTHTPTTTMNHVMDTLPTATATAIMTDVDDAGAGHPRRAGPSLSLRRGPRGGAQPRSQGCQRIKIIRINT